MAARSSAVSLTYLQQVVAETPEPGADPGERLSFTRVHQHKQGLLRGIEPAPPRSQLPAARADQAGHVSQGPM